MKPPAALVCVLLLAVASRIVGQDVDTIVLKNEDQKFTLIAQIEDRQEAEAFLNLAKGKEPAARLALAEAFLKDYPRSWLLPQVYDAAARSAFDLAKYDVALNYGRVSLRLMPENPSLLILVANIEARDNLFDAAVRDASDALEYLDEIERPPGLSQKEWNSLRPQMKASAYFARGRAKTANAPAGPGLASALDDLNRAAAWNSEDAEVFFLRAVVELRLGKQREAASDLAFVLSDSEALREKARNALVLLARKLSPAATSLDEFVRTLPPRVVDANLRKERPAGEYSGVLAAGYAGPEVCKNCHEAEYGRWRQTGMAKMLRPYRAENIMGDFSPRTEFTDDDGGRIRMGLEARKNARPYFEIFGKSEWQRFYVDYTIGSKWQQGYVTKLADGRMQVLPIEYNALQKKWINYWKMIDPAGSARAVIGDFPKMSAATNYQQNCAICHTSQLKADAKAADPMQHAAFLQPGVDCEMCHGPAAWHVQRAAKGNVDTSEALRPPVDFRRVNNRDGVRVCAQCHRQSAVRQIGEGGEMNFSTNGNFVAATWMRSYDAFSRKAFYKDGRFRETTFIAEAFTRSSCYRRGTAQCASCHSPHLPDFEKNQTSLKYVENVNEMCLQCHADFRNRIASHTRHQAESEGSQCVSCHMPRIVNAVLFKARSHQIEIPTADLTERFGQQESPNACLQCHSEKSASWVKEKLAQWAR